jgi:transcriptional regulator with XRE-family HTH domain
MSPIRQCLATNLKALRARNDLTQAGLAEKAKLSLSYIGEIEVGRKYPNPEKLERLARALFVQPFQLLMSPQDSSDYLKYRETVDLYESFADRIELRLEEKFDAYLALKSK